MYHIPVKADRSTFASLIEILSVTDNLAFLEDLRKNGVASAVQLEAAGKSHLRSIMGDMALDNLWARRHQQASNKRRRKDLPDLHEHRRGSIQRAEHAVASSYGALAPARTGDGTNHLDIDSLFEADKFAKTTQGPRESRWKTWQHLAKLRQLPPLPVTIDLVDKIGAAFKAGKYRSAKLYFCRARQEHVDKYHARLAPDVEAAITRAIRSINRGMGPDKPKDSFQLERLRDLDQCEQAIRRHLLLRGVEAHELPLCCTTVAICSTWFLLRGIEIAAAQWDDWFLDDEQQCLRWNLPVSKTDTEAKGAMRSHHCSCSSTVSAICPYHTAKRYRDMHRKRSSGPLFQDQNGHPLSKQTVARLAEALAQYLQSNDMDEWPTDTVQKWAEHAFRVSGAQMFARAGLDLYLIQLLGRWGSRAIERYVQDAPLANTAWAAQAVAGLHDSNEPRFASNMQEAEPIAVCSQQASEETIEDVVTKHAAWSSDSLRRAVTKAMSDQQWFIHNPKSKKVHLPDMGELGRQSDNWRTKCSRWRYGLASHVRHVEILPGFHKCERCFEGVCDDDVNSCSSDEESSSSSS